MLERHDAERRNIAMNEKSLSSEWPPTKSVNQTMYKA